VNAIKAVTQTDTTRKPLAHLSVRETFSMMKISEEDFPTNYVRVGPHTARYRRTLFRKLKLENPEIARNSSVLMKRFEPQIFAQNEVVPYCVTCCCVCLPILWRMLLGVSSVAAKKSKFKMNYCSNPSSRKFFALNYGGQGVLKPDHSDQHKPANSGV
jgi:hypothetical protein